MNFFSKILRGLAQDIAFLRSLETSFVSLADPFGIIRSLGFIMHSFNARTLSGAVLLDPRMQRGTVEPELC